uniref:Transcription initiation factor TFIID subunit 2 isoform X2 n=1 Tax=Rhizophora mucronata TaxID=61149 RepID=A0A2P2MHT8_RHIMU
MGLIASVYMEKFDRGSLWQCCKCWKSKWDRSPFVRFYRKLLLGLKIQSLLDLLVQRR